MRSEPSLSERIEIDGFALIAGAVTRSMVASVATKLALTLEQADMHAGPIRKSRELAVASRNLLRLWPEVVELARLPALGGAVANVLGAGCGLVRALYFDKPPGGSWSLPWHKDLTIAVREHRLEDASFTKPTVKGGVPHVEAPESVLRRMLTARIHLDDVNDENGPLLVIPGSHRDGKTQSEISPNLQFQSIHAAAGDVLLIRPLVTHCSRHSISAAQRRRIVHLEFAAADAMTGEHAWYEFHRLVVSERPTCGVEA